MPAKKQKKFDIFIIGGGINGVGIARDTAGRGLKVGLAEMGDIGSGTSSASTKLFHGGLRYLEHFEFNLVKEALKEREILLSAMPHISWPMKFVVPYNRGMLFDQSSPSSRLLSFFMPWNKNKRPFWLIRIGLFLYDNLGARKILPSSRVIDLRTDPAGKPIKKKFTKAFEYSDCWVEDSRLVILNARDAYNKGAMILPRHKVISAKRKKNKWVIELKNQDSGESLTYFCKLLVNASGPWVKNVITNTLKINSSLSIRLVKGSHIVTKKLYEHEKCYFLQGKDGRIIFTIPYERDFTLIGTTEEVHKNIELNCSCSEEEKKYLLKFVNEYFDKPVTKNDIVWSYSGIRPLYDDGSNSSSAISRDYCLELDQNTLNAPLLNVYGGKITTYRKLAEAAFEKMHHLFPQSGKNWTEKEHLPGGDFEINGFEALVSDILKRYTFLEGSFANRLVRLYGTEVYKMLKSKKTIDDLGQHFGSTLYSFEVDWTLKHEWVTEVEDLIWRRTKLGLRLNSSQIHSVRQYINNKIL